MMRGILDENRQASSMKQKVARRLGDGDVSHSATFCLGWPSLELYFRHAEWGCAFLGDGLWIVFLMKIVQQVQHY